MTLLMDTSLPVCILFETPVSTGFTVTSRLTKG